MHFYKISDISCHFLLKPLLAFIFCTFGFSKHFKSPMNIQFVASSSQKPHMLQRTIRCCHCPWVWSLFALLLQPYFGSFVRPWSTTNWRSSFPQGWGRLLLFLKCSERKTPVTNSLNSVAYSSKSLCLMSTSDICIHSTVGQFVCSPMGTGKKKSGMRNWRGF